MSSHETTATPPGRTDHAAPPDRSDTDVVGARIGAQVVDIVLMTVQVAVLITVLAPDPVSMFLAFLTLPFYGGLQEAYWNGQTVGKKLFDIRVVSEQGGACSVGQAFARNIPAFAMPGWVVYLVALVSMASSDTRQRVFDRVAATVVVHA